MQSTPHHFRVRGLPDGSAGPELVFYDWGDVNASQCVICVHGLTRNARDFDVLAAELAKRGRRVISISMPGRGQSPWLADPMGYTYINYMAACIAVMDNFHLRQVDWVGTSMGGIIGMMLASTYPDRIRKLVLNDVGTLLKKEALQRIYTYVQSIPESFADRATADTYLRDVFKPFGITDPAQWEAFVDSSLLPQPDGRLKLACDPAIIAPIRHDTKNFTELNDVNIAPIWDNVRQPTLILRGELSDILDDETVSAMRKTNTKAETVTIAGVGHAPSLMTAEQVSLVADWLFAAPLRMVGI